MSCNGADVSSDDLCYVSNFVYANPLRRFHVVNNCLLSCLCETLCSHKYRSHAYNFRWTNMDLQSNCSLRMIYHSRLICSGASRFACDGEIVCIGHSTQWPWNERRLSINRPSVSGGPSGLNINEKVVVMYVYMCPPKNISLECFQNVCLVLW
jgi:hypothetical protein